MKILHVNTSDDGGAAQAAIRLHLDLLKKEIDSKFLCQVVNKPMFPGRVRLAKRAPGLYERILLKIGIKQTLKEKRKNVLQGRPSKFDIFTLSESESDITSSPAFQEADIIHLHWISMFLDYKSFFRKCHKPIVWTFHDLNAFTGGCHYSGTCEGFKKDCKNCPQLEGTQDPNYANKVLSSKQGSLGAYKNVHVVTPSKWLSEVSMSSMVTGKFPHTVIPNGIDENTFQRRDRFFSRQLLGLPQDKKIILFVSQFLTIERKGFRLLVEAASHLDREDLVLCSIGVKFEEVNNIKNHINLGTIHDQRIMSMAYSAADAFVIPSLEDNLPNTVIESLMCGTPVIGFPIGGIKEMIDDGKNGILCSEVSIEALQKAILEFIDLSNHFDHVSISNNAKSHYNIDLMSQRYMTLYDQIASEQKDV
ncbi:glycosyltransferase [Fulvivirgaceae bacterium BMA10]|uniref:Glycosyltransferase n=1 Tax=Splendidivirga corallicola TaxID=3051826 RepID=A0ABT8KQS6_9BACT|nr:glycosyltransferase [Fulvivirgaceae bacterium BMA10]